MSKMFDSLRRAEDERARDKLETPEMSPAAPTSRVVRRPPVPAAPSTLEHGFINEMGILRNSLESVFKKTRRRAILFASATAGEGTTTIATGFGKFLAAQGMMGVLVCEMNARRPNFRNVFSTNGQSGVTDYFMTNRALSTFVHPLGGRGMGVLHVGTQDPSVIQLRLEDAFPRLLQEAYERYDTIIIDAPPVISCPETPGMSSFVDGVVMVVHAGKTKREIVQRSLDSIANFKGEVLGVVLNRKKYYIPEFLYKRI